MASREGRKGHTMSDIYCDCGSKPILVSGSDFKLYRWNKCRKCVDWNYAKSQGMSEPTFPTAMPQVFHDTKIELLHPKVQSALNWKPDGDKSGLIFHGTTGLGKTRGIWEIVRKMWLAEIQKDKILQYNFLTMRKLEAKISSSFANQTHEKEIDGLINVELLVLDDLGKERLTSRMATDLFAIIDERSIARRPTIISTNFTGSTLIDRFDAKDKETGVAMIRRLKDYYHIVGIT